MKRSELYYSFNLFSLKIATSDILGGCIGITSAIRSRQKSSGIFEKHLPSVKPMELLEVWVVTQPIEKLRDYHQQGAFQVVFDGCFTGWRTVLGHFV